MEKTIEELYEKHLTKEPKQFEETFIKLGGKNCFDGDFETLEHIGWRHMKERLQDLIEVGSSKRNEILRVIKSGKTLGEVREEFEESLQIVSDVLYFNIESEDVLKEVSI